MPAKIHKRGRTRRLATLLILAAVVLPRMSNAQRADTTSSSVDSRTVVGNAIISPGAPAAEFVVDASLRYIGQHVVDLYGNSEAQQFMFVAGPRAGAVDRFCWVQFEHFLPTNTLKFDQNAGTVTELGDLSFQYDVWAYLDYSISTEDPKSDGAAAAALLARHGLAFPSRVARVRLLNFPTADRRREVMIIYGESVPDSSTIPVTGNRVSLDRHAPAAAALLLARARAAITARARSDSPARRGSRSPF
jgi:hypothetical protein